MKKCYDCTHVEMCGWRKEVKEQGCEFFGDGIGWIPVSERLPEKNGCYLVSTTGENNNIIDMSFYIEGLWHKASRIKAWMPLPEPYKGGEEK